LAQPSLDHALEDLKDARESVASEMMEMRNTGVSIVSAFHNNTTSVLNISIMNSGSSVLTASEVDLLLNGTYLSGGLGSSRYIYPGQTATLTVNNVTEPRSVKVVGPFGISDTTSSIKRG
jgi:archaellum component FlaF (FlaF/FlaG flagellin family)